MMKTLFCALTRGVLSTLVLAFIIAGAGPVIAQQLSPDLFKSLHWRSIGPFRGGRTRAVAGVPSQPNVFYIAQVNGGVWKTDDFGGTWTPIFDDQPTGSVGCIAVAPSDPNIIYAGSGEGLQRPDLSVGDGIYRSSDAGRPADSTDRDRSAGSESHPGCRGWSPVWPKRRARHFSLCRWRQNVREGS